MGDRKVKHSINCSRFIKKSYIDSIGQAEKLILTSQNTPYHG